MGCTEPAAIAAVAGADGGVPISGRVGRMRRDATIGARPQFWIAPASGGPTIFTVVAALATGHLRIRGCGYVVDKATDGAPRFVWSAHASIAPSPEAVRRTLTHANATARPTIYLIALEYRGTDPAHYQIRSGTPG